MAKSVDISLLIRALSDPGFYPHKPARVEFTQTQMSLVFLTGEYAYKIKKPVNLGYLDYTTLEDRRKFCYQELELNRRLSPDVYLEVVPITQSGDGQLELAGNDQIVEYAVKMKQLPLDRTMDNLLRRGEVTADMVAKVAEKVAQFHDIAATNPEISRFGKLSAIRVNIDENEHQTEKYVGLSVPAHEYTRINQYNQEFAANNLNLLQKRVLEGRIKDCHGDLHAAHVCFSNGIDIFDCIEFNDRFRYCDVASEIAFLAMDIERYDRSDLSRSFVNSYVESSKDNELLDLLNFYKCYRACVRGKVESFKLDDPLIPEKEKVLATAKNYFHLAYRYTMKKPLVLVISGLMGTGKTSLAQALSVNTGFTVLSSDVTRKKLAGIPETEHRFEDFDGGIYSGDFTGKTYSKLIEDARSILQSGESVILDASFRKKQERALAYGLANEMNAGFMIIECVLDEAEIKGRLDKRLTETSASDGRREIFEKQKQDSDKITEFAESEHLIIETSRPVYEIVEQVLERI